MNDAYDSLLELARKRRTTRRFKSTPIPDEYITKIIDVARFAPSGYHTQPWEFVVIADKELRKKVLALLGQDGPPTGNPNDEAPETGRFNVAPVFIILLGDWRAKVGLPDAVRSSDARVDSILRASLACAFLSMQFAATSLGLASQWYSAVSNEKTQSGVKSLIGIPEGLRIFDMMVLGYAAEEPIPKDVRGARHHSSLRCLRGGGLQD